MRWLSTFLFSRVAHWVADLKRQNMLASSTRLMRGIEVSLHIVRFLAGVVAPIALVIGAAQILKDGTFPFRGRDLSSPSGFYTYQVAGAGVLFAASAMMAAAAVIHMLAYWFFAQPTRPLSRHFITFTASVLCASVLAFIVRELLYG
jgi:hypothetical protein